jgi:KaiC/GvpD/RAD55 family RecA-like ATPase
MSPEDEPAGEYNRYRLKLQRGDGPDRRGDVAVEVVREVDPDRDLKRSHEVELPDGNTVRVATDDEAFAEFYMEARRAEGVLLDRLGLDRDDG